ncbi:heavy metal translocating P-type ATPase [Desulfobulbus sp.]|uniref:heavy metal translocating P-type ATPase n=1 Tax=Desulfobulbus sp. TaxID=895 RepID=UPI00286F52D0|nr:heavy metal translocating P-type ATPase [Desulfobulbus sp.]
MSRIIVTTMPVSISIVHDLPGRLRLRGGSNREAALLSRGVALQTQAGVLATHHSPVGRSLLVLYDPAVISRGDLLLNLYDALVRETAMGAGAMPVAAPAQAAPSLAGLILPLVFRPLLPLGLRQVLAFKTAWPRLRKGLASLARGLLDIDVLDAAAIGLCIVRRDFRTLTTITVLLGLGEFLESWTKKRSEASLADSLARHSIKANLRLGETEQQVDASTLRAGDMVVVRQGSFIPADGVVMEGEGLVDQSLMSGEAKLQDKRVGKAVFAGSLLEEGELLIQATEDGDKTVWRRTMLLLHDAEQRKASIQGQAEQLASRLAPFSLLLAGLVFLVTGDPRRAASVLLVDYSCAIKLATPLAILSSMRQAASVGAAVRGGRHLEDLAKADVFVFDKTGTLTMAAPSVKEIAPCNGWNRNEALRLAACLEEHFPHPVAKAVVRQAAAEGLEHAERHAMVEYVTAHGVASCLDGHRVLLGSRHFVEEDEGVDLAPLASHIDRWNELGHTILYLTMGGELLAGFALDDPPRPEAAQVIASLRAMGVKRIIMLTGDLDGMAERMARELGITEWVAQVLPDDKFRFVCDLKNQGHVVAMVGDGLNDAAALAEASVGCCMRRGADMARDAADIVLTENELVTLPLLRSLATATLTRVQRNFAFIVGTNTLFLLGGLFGLTSPALGAFLHNSATVAVAANALRPYKLPAIGSPSGSDFIGGAQ